MSIELTIKEEDSFNVYWKIKNFSYCKEPISSPEFNCDGDLYSIFIFPESMLCELRIIADDRQTVFMQYLLSFLTCDGSPPLTSDSDCLHVPSETFFGTRRNSFLPDDTLTVKCQFSAASKRGKLLVRSKIGVKRRCFVWRMENFIQEHQQNENDFRILVENCDRFGIGEMQLKSTDGIHSDAQFYIEITLDHGEKCFCVLEVSVLDTDGNTVNCINGAHLFKVECHKQTWKFPPVIKKRKLLACKDQLMPNGTLSLKCNFAITIGAIMEETAVLSYSGDPTNLRQENADISKYFQGIIATNSVTDLKSDLKKMLDNESFSDVNLQVDSQVVPVHMNILGARSPVFASRFMEENNDNTVVIQDLDLDTVNRLILYMYTDTIHDSNWKNIKKLYLAAKRYEVQSLKQKCTFFLISKFSIYNICDALAISNSHKDANLKAAALEFISKHGSEVFASKKWKDLEKNNSSLAMETLREICLQKSSN